MENGNKPGLNQDSWSYYVPPIRTASVTGSSTQPIQGTGVAEPLGRYTRTTDQNLIMAQSQYVFGSSANKGVGNSYLFKIPIPAKKIFGDNYQHLIGYGLFYHAQTGNAYNMPMIMVQSKHYQDNPGFARDYAECIIAGFALTFGTGSISGRTATSTTITHNLGFTPNVNDIDITWTGADNAALQSTQGHWWISNITSTTFDVNIRNPVDL